MKLGSAFHTSELELSRALGLGVALSEERLGQELPTSDFPVGNSNTFK